MTVNGALNIIQVVRWIVDQQIRDIDFTPESVRLLVNLLCTASDIQGEIGNYTDAYKLAKEARELVEPLRTKNPDAPEVLKLLYITTWRIGDAISYRGSDPTYGSNPTY